MAAVAGRTQVPSASVAVAPAHKLLRLRRLLRRRRHLWHRQVLHWVCLASAVAGAGRMMMIRGMAQGERCRW